MRRMAVFAVAAVGVLGVGLGNAFADPAVSGTYKLDSRRYGSPTSTKYTVKVWLQNLGNGRVSVTRQEVGANGQTLTALSGTGTVESTGWVRVSFDTAVGMTNLPIFNGGGTTVPPGTYYARYRVQGNRITSGFARVPDRSNNLVSRNENGNKVAAEPVPGGGGTPPPVTEPPPPPANDLASLKAQVVRIDPVGTIDISDVGDTAFQRALGAAAPSVAEPIAMLKDKKLTIRLWVAAERNPTAAMDATLTGTAGGKVLFSKAVQLSSLTGNGQEFSLESSEAVSAKVAINALDVAWKLNDVAIGNSALRVYTTLAAPIHNIDWDPTTTATKRHFENACRWANGASKGIGQGADSVPYQQDNQMRHYVHPSELGNVVPVVPDYAANAVKPKNYDDLDGWVSNGVRSISSLYYPPLEVSKPYEEYENFRGNFGWQVLDNPNYVGGRCNQQASLVAAIVGTIGMKAKVHYLERTGRGKRTGRPVRNYFYAQGGGGPWNFHGVCLVDLSDGTQWIYDGSFSSPPNRKNGTKQWAENAGGPFVGSWADWYYEDFGGKVPADDRPDTWNGVQ